MKAFAPFPDAKRVSLPRLLRAIAAICAASLVTSAFAADKEVTIAYQDMMVPWRYAQQLDEAGKETGYKVSYRKFGGGGDVIRAMASGNVQLGEAGSSPVAAGLSQGLPIQLFWILDNINDAEALVVRDGSGVTSVAGLKGKRLGVPFVSTSHFHALLAIKKAGLADGDVKVLNMRPAEIAAAWARGDIDAAYVWNPVLTKIEANGKVVTTSGKIASQTGLATFDGFVVNSDWAKANPQFMTSFVKILAKGDADYRAHPDQWVGTTPQGKAIAEVSGGAPDEVKDSLALYQFPTPQEQMSDKWLGGGKNSGAAKSLLATAQFLKEQKTLQSTLPDYSVGVTDQYIKAAAAAK
ncbi:taurine ABC transporter substrate-binding protein [Paraburkholderia sp. BCC1884]|uniref:taurine ABC transporter substrate-binding protein n=1 Tax=Paraburkholderia sp. BCC1884 TaxID=2562668 RepID=UPI00118419BF|nr:taurine ABC transporter substrate-binding protein [Paraburkholderia sp. BCC1884]